MDREEKSRKSRSGGVDVTTLDEKNRIVIGSAKRDVLGDNFALYINPYGFIEASTEAEVDSRLEQLSVIGRYKPEVMHLREMWEKTIEWDNNIHPVSHRLSIPAGLAKLTKLEKGSEVAVAGQSTITIARWDQYELFMSGEAPISKRFTVIQEAMNAVESVFAMKSPLEETR